MKNGRWIQLSWEPTFLEMSFEIVQNSNKILFKVYEDYHLEYDVHVGHNEINSPETHIIHSMIEINNFDFLIGKWRIINRR